MTPFKDAHFVHGPLSRTGPIKHNRSYEDIKRVLIYVERMLVTYMLLCIRYPRV